jgi:hypothetical protein
MAELDATFSLPEYPSTSSATCGTSQTLPCDQFDIAAPHGEFLEASDAYPWDAQVGRPPVPGSTAGAKCAACGVDFLALPCVGDACIECNDGIDNDDDGWIDYQGGTGDPNCTSNADDREAADGTSGCGIGPELSVLLLGLGALRRRRSARGPGPVLSP